MIRTLYIVVLLVFIVNSSFSQEKIDSNFIYTVAIAPNDTLGAIAIFQEENIQSLLEKKIKVNEARPYQFGYRLQIMSLTGANSRDDVNMEKAKILMKYDNVEVYIVYNSPYFKLRIGDFRTELEAVHYLQAITKDYPQAFVVKDKVNIPYDIEKQKSKQSVEENQ